MTEISNPPGDPNFDKILLKMFNNNTPEFKKELFFKVCIIVRFILYIIVYLNINNNIVYYLILLLALFSSYNLSSDLIKGNNNQWWSKKFQLVISLSIIIIYIVQIFINNSIRVLIPLLLMISLFGGIFQRLLIT
jgi:uncharacterized membrane protein YiaA